MFRIWTWTTLFLTLYYQYRNKCFVDIENVFVELGHIFIAIIDQFTHMKIAHLSAFPNWFCNNWNIWFWRRKLPTKVPEPRKTCSYWSLPYFEKALPRSGWMIYSRKVGDDININTKSFLLIVNSLRSNSEFPSRLYFGLNYAEDRTAKSKLFAQ